MQYMPKWTIQILLAAMGIMLNGNSDVGANSMQVSRCEAEGGMKAVSEITMVAPTFGGPVANALWCTA